MRPLFLPRPLRFALFRNRLRLPALDTSGLEFKPAETLEEFHSAFRILHDSYVEFQYMQPSPSGMRVTPYHLLPGTVTLIVKCDQEVVGTVAIVRDNMLGLPMDKIFDLYHLRKTGARLAEISALAIRKDFRLKKGALLHRFIRYLWKFTREYLAVDLFVCAVNPAMNELYESIYLFKSVPNGKRVNEYDFVNGAPAVGLVAPVGENFPAWQRIYGNRESGSNLFDFINQPFLPNEFHLSPVYYSIFRNSMSTEVRDQLLRDPLLNPMQQLSLEEKFKVLCQLSSPQRLEMDLLNGVITPRPRSERFDVYCPIANLPTRVLDASETGLKLAKTSWPNGRAPDFLPIQLGPDRMARVKTRIRWETRSGVSGHEIVDADSSWEEFISHLQASTIAPPWKKTG